MSDASSTAPPPARIHLPSLVTAVLIMLAGSVYPPFLADGSGHADHRLALVVLLAMTAGFVRGVGFIPRRRPWRWLFSGWSCAALLALAGYLELSL